MFIDLHCDSASSALFSDREAAPHLLYENPKAHLDVKRLKELSAFAQFFAVYVPPASHYASLGITEDMEYVHAVLAVIRDCIAAHPEAVALAKSAGDLAQNRKRGLVSAFLTLEEGRPVDGRMENIDRLYAEGIRLITLTWNYKNCFGSPNSADPAVMQEGLTPFGKDAVQRMNELHMLIDVSHLSDGGFRDVCALSTAPFIASHSNARSLCPHPRNLTDSMIRALSEKGGVIGLNFCPSFVDASGVSTVSGLIRHARHIADVGGIGCLALGSDFDGIGGELEMNDVRKMPLLMERLHQSGFTASEVEQIAYKNAERVISDVLR